jgi:hypothetical protein
MKSKEEIEQLAFLEYPRLINDPYNPMVDDNADERKIWINAYSQCQEDMADKKYTEEDMLKLWNTLMVAMTNHNPIFFKDYINSLNKQD